MIGKAATFNGYEKIDSAEDREGHDFSRAIKALRYRGLQPLRFAVVFD
jgi:hypothetical protein